jgi:hypothetical protein
MPEQLFDGEGLPLHLIVLKYFSFEFQFGAKVRSKLSGVEFADHYLFELVQNFFGIGR